MAENDTPLLERDTTIGTVRTAVNGTVGTAVLLLLNKLLGWELSLEDLLPYTPLALPVIAAGYRASLWAAERFPSLGWVLFGIRKRPAYPPPPPAPVLP